MIDGLELARMRTEAAETAAKENQTPFVPTARTKARAMGGDWTIIKIPNFGDYRPDGWKLGQTYFVDKTGWDDGGPAMSIEGLIYRMIPGRGYAMIEEGQFQCHVGEFTQSERSADRD